MTYEEIFERIEKMLNDLKEMLDKPDLPQEVLDKIECRIEDIGELIERTEKILDKEIRLNS